LTKTVVLAALRSLARRSPRAAVLVAQALAQATRRLGFGIATEQLARAFPHLTRDELRSARAGTWASFLKGEALDAAARHGSSTGFYPPTASTSALAELEPPLILITFHVGPFQALGAGLRVLRSDTMALTREQFESRPGVDLVGTGETEGGRARIFHQALSKLRSGGFVLITVDAFHPDEFAVSTIEAPVLGGTLRMARGAFALARITQTPIVPLVSRWRGSAMEFTVGDPIAPGPDEAAMAEAAGRWIDGYLRERPGELTVFMLNLLRWPAGR
jgi:lauroyl/myristoyl acyltransferase